MATYTITATPSGSNKDNDAQRDIAAVFPYDANQYRTISELARRDGIWCSCGGKYQSVTLSGYDQLINSSTGAVIKTSGTGTCKCHGTGPAAENYMTCTFSDWTQAESNAAVAAWKAGTLIIRRTVSITAYTSSGHGEPTFRDGYYDDTITITGSTAPFTDYRPQITTFKCFRSEDGVTESQLSTTVYATIKLAMNDTSGLNDSPKLVLEYSTKADFSSGVTSITMASSASLLQYYLDGYTISVRGEFSVGSNYYFRLTFTAGEEVAQVSGVSVSMSHTPIHIPQNNSGVAVGMYSNATSADRRFECNYPAYLYGGIAQIGDGNGDLLTLLGIQTGSSAAQSVANSKTATVDVVFARAYKEAPVVVANIVSESDSYYLGRCNVAIQSVSTTGFTARIANGGSAAVVFGFNWAAFGKLT